MRDLSTFLTVLAVAYVVPGPDLIVVMQGARLGLAAGARTAAGVVMGLMLHAVLAGAGAAALVAGLPGALTSLRIAGGAYLTVLGWRILRTTRATSTTDQATSAASAGFRAGFLTNVLNPKAILFFLVVIPSFAGTPAAAATLAALTILFGVVWWTLVVAAVASGLRGARGIATARSVDVLLGTVLIGLGATIATGL